MGLVACEEKLDKDFAVCYSNPAENWGRVYLWVMIIGGLFHFLGGLLPENRNVLLPVFVIKEMIKLKLIWNTENWPTQI